MKAMMLKLMNLLFIGLFGFAVVTPAYAAWGFPKIFGLGRGDHENVTEATATPTFPPKNTLRGEIHEDIATHPGGLRGFLKTRGVIMGNITAINGTSLSVTTKDGKNFTVQTDNKTQFRRLFWGKSSLGEMSVGDLVNVIGKWTDDSHTIIQAILVRDLSIQKFMGVFFGTVQSLTSSGWVMTTINRGNQTVTVSSSTKFTDRKGTAISQSDVAVGHKIRVRGLWDKTAGTITSVTAVKDFSLPPMTTPTVTVTPTETPVATVTPTPTP